MEFGPFTYDEEDIGAQRVSMDLETFRDLVCETTFRGDPMPEAKHRADSATELLNHAYGETD